MKHAKRKRLYDYLPWIVALIMTICSIWILFYSTVVYIHIKSGDLKSFTGSYSVEDIHLHRNTVYFITLENGDRLILLPELVQENEFGIKYDELSFAYSVPYRPLCGAYTVVSIQSIDEEKEIVSLDASTDEMGSTAIIGFGLACVFVILIYVMIPYRHK